MKLLWGELLLAFLCVAIPSMVQAADDPTDEAIAGDVEYVDGDEDSIYFEDPKDEKTSIYLHKSA